MSFFSLGMFSARCLVALVVLATAAIADTAADSREAGERHVVLLGDVPVDDFPGIQERADQIWSFLTQRLNLSKQHPLPVIYFHPFDKETQSREWTRWQKAWTREHPAIWREWTALKSPEPVEEISRQWIDSNIDEIFPFPRSFLAFHYDGTNRIQINPNRTFRASAGVEPYRPNRIGGFGYYTLGHEMLHYALENKGVVPSKLHHCLFLYMGESGEDPGLMDELGSFLVDEGFVAPFSRHRALRTERMLQPCKRLTGEELGLVRSLYSQLHSAGGPGGQSHVR